MTELFAYLQQNFVETTGAILTILCVWLNTKASIWGWVVGMISTFCYIYVAYSVHLWGFAILNIFFLLLSIYGLWNWKYGNKTSIKLVITTTNIQNILFIIVLGIILTVIFYYILAKTGSASPSLDALIFAFSMLAQGLLANKKIENWIFWIIINAITVYMFYSLAAWISAGLYTILFALAIRGYREWKIKMTYYLTDK